MFNNDNGFNKISAREISKNFSRVQRINDKTSVARQQVLKDCIVVGVKGIKSFSQEFGEDEQGTILVDVLFPEGRFITRNGIKYYGIDGVRCRQSFETLGLEIGCEEEDYIGAIGDIVYNNETYDGLRHFGEFTFKKQTKKFQVISGLISESPASTYSDKFFAHLGAFYGDNDSNNVKKYIELFKKENST